MSDPLATLALVARVKALYSCADCGRTSGQWSGRCSSCGAWGTIAEHATGATLRSGVRALGISRGRPSRVATLTIEREEHRIGTGFPAVDRVLGGGLVPGSVVLLAGAPGIGKSTLLLQLASRLTIAGHPCLLASGEEAGPQVAARASRLGLDGDGMAFVPGRDLAEVVESAEAAKPEVLVVDSIHTIREAGSDGLPGGPSQVRGCADALIGLAKDQGVTVVLIGHVTKEGDLAGPRTLEHAVDTVLAFEGDPRSGLRVLSSGKNRFGPEGEVAWFEMRPTGLVEAEPGPRVGDAGADPGSATALPMVGRRALAVDVQALVGASEGPPRRQVAGLDPRRFHIVAAVTDRSVGLRLARSELFGAASGGMRLDDPGVDLAVAAALASAGTGRAPPPDTAFVGEVALTGAVRPVAGMDQRMAAASAAGLRAVICPVPSAPSDAAARNVRVVPVGHLREALAWAVGPARGRTAKT